MSTGRAVGLAFGVVVLAVLVGNHLFAIPVEWAVALSLPLGAVVLLGAVLSGASDANWEPLPAPGMTPSELHASTLATRFAEAAEDHHRFRTRVRPRLVRMVLATLRARPGTSDLAGLNDPRAREALGADLHRVLTDDSATLPDPRSLAAMLQRLEGP